MRKNRLLYLLVVPMLLVSGCAERSNRGGQTPSDGSINYNVEYHFESLAGDYVVDNAKTVTGTGNAGTVFNAEVKTFEGFTFDSNNVNNKVSGTLSNNEKDFDLYYSRNEYTVTVYGGVSDKNIAKYEDTITVTPNVPNAELVLNDNSKATINGYQVTLGAEDLTIKCLARSRALLNDELFTGANDFTAKVTINITDPSNLNGLTFLYNSENMSDDGDIKYYLFGSLNDKIGFYYFHNGILSTIKQDNLVASLTGSHSFAVSVASSGDIDCYLDEIGVLSVSNEDIINQDLNLIKFGGKVGVYSHSRLFNYQNLNVASGLLSLNGIKEFFINELCTFHFSKHVFDTYLCVMDEGDVVIDLRTLPTSANKFAAYVDSINAANSVPEIETALSGAVAEKLEAQKAYTKEHLLQLLYDIHYSTFMFYVETTETKYFDSGVTLYRDYLARDLRFYVPDAYKLYGEEGSTCLLDQLDIDLANAKTSSEVYSITDTYALDLVKALCFRDYEYYFWENYNKYPNTTYPVWDWFLYTYYGAGGSGFVYTGNVFKNFTWNKDFRISRYIFAPAESGGQFDILTVISGANWMMQAQTIQSRKYTVTLNADGGQLESYTLNGDSSAELTLPTPTKTGYVFDGWYTSRVLKGESSKYTSIPANNYKDVTLYAAYKKDGSRVASDVLPADYLTENMIIQQNKPIIISGTGKDGLTVTVTFNGQNKSATIEEGKWKVVFDALEASFSPRSVVITSGDIVYTFNNVLIGEVWLGAGQSNMEMLPTWLNNRGIKYVGELGDHTNFEKIRIFRQYVDDLPTTYEENYLQNRWAAPSAVKDLFDKSFLSVVYACELQEKLNVPVGVLTSARGDTFIEEWLSEESLAIAGSSLSSINKALESRYYNQMTTDLIGMQISGVILYHGENNYAHAQEYKPQLAQLVKQYREVFADDDLVVIAQQLVQYGGHDLKDVRLVQWELMHELENYYCSCSIDEGEETDIHPANKHILGKRMCDIACQYVYNIGSDSLSYEPVSASVEGGKIVISFENGKTIHSDKPLQYFKVQKTDNTFVNVNAEIVNNKIVIDNVENAKSVYYAHASWLGEITLYGGNNKPVVPFIINIA